MSVLPLSRNLADGDGYQSDDDNMVDGYWDPQLDEDAEDFHRGD
jgi:hypothetical protein